MLLVLDIGNTNIVVGCFNAKDLLFELRLKTDAGRTIDEYASLLFSLFDRHLGKQWKFERCIISSVVPQLTGEVIKLVEDKLKVKSILVGPGIKTAMPIKTTDPAALGSDRIVNAVAAREIFGAPALVVDFGTATSFDFVSAEGAYEGGIIAPGLNIALESLVRNTAKLPRIELLWPKSAIGKSTVSAMQVGSLMGYVCLVDGLIERVSAEVGEIEHIVATGGLGEIISKHSARIKHYDPHLTLKGLRILAELNGG